MAKTNSLKSTRANLANLANHEIGPHWLMLRARPPFAFNALRLAPCAGGIQRSDIYR